MPDWLVQVLAMFGAAAGIYAGIRADLATIRARAETAHESAKEAHVRIDNFFNHGGRA